jgi:hypothetical protein
MKPTMALLLIMLGLAACAPQPRTRVYRETQFASRLEYLRFCQHFELQTYRCAD